MAGAQALAGELPGAVLQGAAALGGGSGVVGGGSGVAGGGSGVAGGGVGDGIGGEGGGHGGYPFGWEEMHRGLKATANPICGELAGFGKRGSAAHARVGDARRRVQAHRQWLGGSIEHEFKFGKR